MQGGDSRPEHPATVGAVFVKIARQMIKRLKITMIAHSMINSVVLTAV
jgi:hypothetical protein